MKPLVVALEQYEELASALVSLAQGETGIIERDRFPDGEHYLRVISEVNDRDVVLVGHSGGGAIAHAVADARPERVARVIYVDSLPLGHGASFFNRRGAAQMNASSEFRASAVRA